MSVDREYKIRIAAIREPKVGPPITELKVPVTAKTNPTGLPAPESPSVESLTGMQGFDGPFTSINSPPGVTTKSKIQEHHEPSLPTRAIPAGGARTPMNKEPANAAETALPQSPESSHTIESRHVSPESPEKPPSATPVNQPAFDLTSLAGLVNQISELHQSLPAQHPSAASQDVSELLSIIRQLRESFSEYSRAQVSRQELRNELASLRLLIESKK